MLKCFRKLYVVFWAIALGGFLALSLLFGLLHWNSLIGALLALLLIITDYLSIHRLCAAKRRRYGLCEACGAVVIRYDLFHGRTKPVFTDPGLPFTNGNPGICMYVKRRLRITRNRRK